MKCCSRCGTQCDDNEKVCHNCLHSLKVIQNNNNNNEQETVDDEYKEGFSLGLRCNWITLKHVKKHLNKKAKEGAEAGYRFGLAISIIGVTIIVCISIIIAVCKIVMNS
jgi:hypothetical protein